MSANDKFINKLFSLLNDNYNYAVLRGYEELPNHNSSHDIDILIEKNDFDKLINKFCTLIEEEKFKVLMYNQNERFNTIIIAKYERDEINFLYLDFFFNYSLYGLHFFDASEVLESRIFNGKIYHVSILYEFLEKYLNCLLLEKPYPSKYNRVKATVYKSYIEKLNLSINKFFYDSSLNAYNIHKPSKYLLIFKVFIGNLYTKPILQIKLSTAFFYYYLRGILKPNGLSISITGPDGSGKTTILNDVLLKFNLIYRESRLHHFRPTVIPRIAELFNKSGFIQEVDDDYNRPHRGAETGSLNSFVRLLYYIFDYILGYYIIVKPVLFRRGLVIFDRYYTDIISDSRRSRINLNYKIIFLFRNIVPKLNYNFLITVNPDLILKRKNELNRFQINEIYRKLDYIYKKGNDYKIIDNNLSPSIAISEVINYILDNQHKKFLAIISK